LNLISKKLKQMKLLKSFFLFFLLAFSFGAKAQSGSDLHEKVYRQALDRGDLNTAIVAVQYIIASDPSEAHWNDTLARLYFNAGQYFIAKNIAEDLLKADPKNQTMLAIAAYGNKNLGMSKEAIGYFEELFAESKNPGHLYELITLQFGLKRYGEAAENINNLLEMPDAVKMKTSVVLPDNNVQEVPLNAAALNIKGVIALEMGNYEAAEQFFKEALEVMPEFALAKQNLSVMQNREEMKEEKEEKEEKTTEKNSKKKRKK